MKAYAERAGLDASAYSGHPLRSIVPPPLSRRGQACPIHKPRPYHLARRRDLVVPSVSRVQRCETLRRPVLAFERHSEDDDMTELPRNDLDSHDWAARAAEALARARALPPGSI